jgi:hypothetical protein
MPMTPHSPSVQPLQALQAALRPLPAAAGKPWLMIAGATGVLGNEVLRRLVGSGRYAHTEVLATEAMTTGMAGVGIVLAGDASVIEAWPARPQPVHTGLVMFEPPRLYYERERTLWTPVPGQLPALAHWLKRCGVQTLVVVVPHASGRLPDALKRGLADLDEQTVASLGFERVLLVRSARKAEGIADANFFEKMASWMLSTLKYMIPATEQPVRPAKLAEFIDAALQALPPGIHVAAPELLWQATQGKGNGWRAGQEDNSMQSVVRLWLAARGSPEQNSTPNAKPD